MSETKGQIQIYTGDGKGKTTAAIGLAIRSAGAGKKVCIIQFDKGSDGTTDFYSERKVLKTLPNVTLIPTGKIRMMPGGTFRFTNSPPDFEEAKRGLEEAKKSIQSNSFDLIVCDEILSCILTQLLSESDVLSLLTLFDQTQHKGDLVLTGRSLPNQIQERADLITEMKMVKHYFNKGLNARKGIEF